MSPTSTLPAWFAHAMEALKSGDTAGYMEMYAPDAVHDFPFAAGGAPRQLSGRDAIAAYVRQIPQRIRFGSLGDIRVRDAGDELIIEATGHHYRVADDTPFEMGCVWFITRRNGKVTHFRDYMSPLQRSAG